jgi:hypothetical protein
MPALSGSARAAPACCRRERMACGCASIVVVVCGVYGLVGWGERFEGALERRLVRSNAIWR